MSVNLINTPCLLLRAFFFTEVRYTRLRSSTCKMAVGVEVDGGDASVEVPTGVA